MTNTLYYGDNLQILRQYIKDESVDLIYLDPPFNSNASYNVLFAEHTGSKSTAQIQAFEDTWKWGEDSDQAYREIVERGGRASQALQAFRQLLGESNMMAYLAMMAPRLIELHRVLKPTGSLYLHCDPTASHYLKLLLDNILGIRNFRNEIIWCYRGGGSKQQDFGKRHDIIFRYSKTDTYNFYSDSVRIPYQAEGIGRKDDAMWGKHSGTNKIYKPNPLGKIPEDWWPINVINANDPERLGYPTQKPETLLERIIKASSNPGDVVLDPFCGCGTSIAVAQRLDRQWIGIDITHLAIALIKHRLETSTGGTAKYKVIGEPTTEEEARTLAEESPYQFQWWALSLVGARPVEQKKGADQGIDGRLFFHFDGSSDTHQIIFSVKAGNLTPAYVRDLHGVIDREKAEIGVLITFNEPTKAMRTEALNAGVYRSAWGDHPKLQIFTVGELLAGKKIDMPPIHREGNATFKKAPRQKSTPDQGKLDI